MIRAGHGSDRIGSDRIGSTSDRGFSDAATDSDRVDVSDSGSDRHPIRSYPQSDPKINKKSLIRFLTRGLRK